MMLEAANRRILMVLGAAAPLALCACTLPSHRIDPDSTLAAQAGEASRNPGAYPRFSAIPQTPTDVRPPAGWAADVAAIKATGEQLQAEAAPSTFTLRETEAFTAEAREIAARGGPVPDAAATRAEADAFARSIRARATPPPSRR